MSEEKDDCKHHWHQILDAKLGSLRFEKGDAVYLGMYCHKCGKVRFSEM
jgi:hypothetical protein